MTLHPMPLMPLMPSASVVRDPEPPYDYRAALRWLCHALAVADAEVPGVLDQQALMLDGLVVGLAHGPAQGAGADLLLIFVELADPGLPEAEQGRRLLERQTSLPPPFPMIFCRPPLGRGCVLRTFAALPTTPERAADLAVLMRATVAAAKTVWD